MKKLVFLICIFCQSCTMDFTSDADILNNSNESVNIKIQYDKLVVDSLRITSNSSKETDFSFLESEVMYKGKSYSIDTMSFSISYILKQKQKLTVTHNPEFKPDLSRIKLIEIKSKSKTIILNKANFNSEFIETERGLWVYTIK